MNNQLEDIKNQLEIDKLKAEVEQLNKGYWRLTVVPVLIPAVVTVFSIIVLYLSVVSDVNEKRIDNKIANFKVMQETFELTKRKEKLNDSIAIIKDSIKYLTQLNFKKTNENKHLKDLVAANQAKVNAFPDALSTQDISGFLEDINSQPDLAYTKNKKKYNAFSKAIKRATLSSFEILNKYVQDDKNTLIARIYVIMAIYNNTANNKPLLEFYHELLHSEICSDRNTDLFKIISNNEWNEEVYHKTIIYILQNGSSCNSSTYRFINSLLSLRNDPKLSAKGNSENFLSYLSLYRNVVMKKENEINTSSINQVIALKNVPLEILTVYLSEYILRNKTSFNAFVTEQAKNQKAYQQMPVKNLATKLKITESDLLSIEFWESINDKNKSLLKRLLEDDFKTYSKDKNQLFDDMKE